MNELAENVQYLSPEIFCPSYQISLSLFSSMIRDNTLCCFSLLLILINHYCLFENRFTKVTTQGLGLKCDCVQKTGVHSDREIQRSHKTTMRLNH